MRPFASIQRARRIRHARSAAYGNKGELNKAIADVAEAIRLDPKSSYAYGVRGCARAEAGDLDKSIADLTEAIRLDPKDAMTYSNRAART